MASLVNFYKYNVEIETIMRRGERWAFDFSYWVIPSDVPDVPLDYPDRCCVTDSVGAIDPWFLVLNITLNRVHPMPI